MTPNELLVHTIIAGATALRTPACPVNIRVAYTELADRLRRAHPIIDLTAVERRPTSPHSRGLLAEELAELGDRLDPELLVAAHALCEQLDHHAPESAAVIGVDLRDIKAAYVRLLNIRSSGVGARLSASDIAGGVEMGDVTAGSITDATPRGHHADIQGNTIGGFPWGDAADPERANCAESKIVTTSAVGCFVTGMSLYGVEELSGNVWEWSQDDDSYGKARRGVSFYMDANRVSAATAFGLHPANEDDVSGFRCVVVPTSCQ